ncbi:MAG: class II glutamine amidotransferase, partial [Candidatus Binatia bacterium]
MGVYGHPEAANMVYLGLYALQHRGQESCGIVSSDGKGLTSHRQMGLVADVFKEDVIKRLEGRSAIGHNRYSTTGQSHLKNAQPFVVEYSQGPIAISHNGNLVNAEILRKELEDSGSIFQSTSDTEVIVHLIATSKESTLMGRIVEALSRARGAYSLLFLTLDRMIAVRDSMGFRPLVVGRFDSGPNEGAYVVASETCALDLIEATYLREVEPGEIITFGSDGMQSLRPFPPAPEAKCVFEYMYFSRPDSNLYG